MYVREKRRRRGEKTYSYWQVVQGTRVDGKVRQTVVAHLGPLPPGWESVGLEPREAADFYARMRGLLCAATGCGREGSEELIGVTGYPEEKHPYQKHPYLWCAKHAAGFRRGENVAAVPLLDPEERARLARPSIP